LKAAESKTQNRCRDCRRLPLKRMNSNSRTICDDAAEANSTKCARAHLREGATEEFLASSQAHSHPPVGKGPAGRERERARRGFPVSSVVRLRYRRGGGPGHGPAGGMGGEERGLLVLGRRLQLSAAHASCAHSTHAGPQASSRGRTGPSTTASGATTRPTARVRMGHVGWRVGGRVENSCSESDDKAHGQGAGPPSARPSRRGLAPGVFAWRAKGGTGPRLQAALWRLGFHALATGLCWCGSICKAIGIHCILLAYVHCRGQ
jgi:hypothetical protein